MGGIFWRCLRRICRRWWIASRRVASHGGACARQSFDSFIRSKGREGKERKGKERKGKERKGKERERKKKKGRKLLTNDEAYDVKGLPQVGQRRLLLHHPLECGQYEVLGVPRMLTRLPSVEEGECVEGVGTGKSDCIEINR